MDKKKESFALSYDQLDSVTGGATGFLGEEIPDYAKCPRCGTYSNVIHIDAGFYECLGCRIAFDTEGRIWEAPTE